MDGSSIHQWFGGRMKYRILWLILFFSVSCIPQSPATSGPDTAVTAPSEDDMSTNQSNLNPFAPKPGDENLLGGNAYINEASLEIRESYPPQVSLSIRGDLPTPCNQLRVKIDAPNQENKITVNVYSLVDPDKVCIQVLEPFQEHIDLGFFSTGHYSVWVNSKSAGEFDA
jgi:hypothetical protein